MRRFLLRSVALAVATAVAADGQALRPNSLRLSCDSTAFSPTIRLEDLVRRFGAENVTADSIAMGEGESEPGTLLFRADPHRRVEIVWQDHQRHSAPSMVRIDGASSLWTTDNGITLGTRLRTLEQLNGKPFRLAGFAFDGSGAIIDWSDGRLARSPTAKCSLAINVDPTVRDAADRRWYKQVTGDRDFSSSHPAMQALNPRVNELRLLYPPPAG